MKIKTFLQITSGMSALMIALGATTASAESPGAEPVASAPVASAIAPVVQDAPVATDQEAEDTDIIVYGIRQSLSKAADKKKNAKQIVDSVVAEDIGKLPDNNVPEALARVSGVQIDRAHGEGQNVTIRGLSDIQTTVNGNDVSSPGSRALNLADIPAELLKSVEVYKTRSADQIEGGIAGTVNVELRRPLDLEKGLTLAGSFRETFSDIGNTKSPYASGLAAYRFDTGLGEMGFLINASYTENHYQENYVVSESPMKVIQGDPNNPTALYLSVPLALRDTLVVPYAINYGVESGVIKRPSLNLAWQWRTSDNLDFVLEGSYLGSRETAYRNNLRLVTNDGNGTYTNIVANSDGTIRSLTLNNPNIVNGGPDTFANKIKGDNYHTNFETHWNGGIAHINFGAQYDWAKSSYYYVETNTRYAGGTSANVDFNSPNVPDGGPFITFPGVNLTDPAANQLFQIHDQIGNNESTQFSTTLDLTLDTSSTGLLRSFQAGYRFSTRTNGYRYGYRDAFFFDPANRPTLDQVATATGIPLGSTTPDVRGAANTPTWIHFGNQQLYNQFDALRRYAITRGADPVGNDLTTERASYNDLGSQFQEREQSFAAYGILNYAFNAGFPVDGQLGLRYVNTWGRAASTQYAFGRNPDGTTNFGSVVTTLVSNNANYVDLLPSATAILHFTPKVQLRLSYTHNVQRPTFFDLRPFQELRDAIANPAGKVYSGNPNLQPVKEDSFDASLEYYFGRGGQLSLGGFLKNQTGFIYYTEASEYVAAINRFAIVGKPRNAGPGKIAGLELSGNTFFDFLGGFAKNFGVQANFTYIPKADLQLAYTDINKDIPGLYQAPYTSKYSGNITLYYETPAFSTRIAYNYRSSFKTGIDYVNPGFSIYSEPTSRLDAAINYTPFKFITFSVEGTNLLHNNTNAYFGAFDALPVGVREQARTIQASARFRF